MTQRLVKASFYACLLLLLPGCIEMTQTITLNPDGRGKVVQEIHIAAMGGFDLNFGGGAPAKEKSLDAIKNDAAINFVSKTKGVAAWKDVSVKWAPDGRLHMVGTAYFDKLGDMTSGAGGDDDKLGPAGAVGSPIPTFDVTVEKDGLKIAGKKADKIPLKKEPTPDFAKMTDKEMDDYVLKQRVQFQMVKPLLVMFFTDLKVKMILRLPGEIHEVKGFKKDKATEVSFTLDGNELLKATKKLMTQDAASLKKTLKEGAPELLASFGLSGDAMEPMLTVRKVGQPLFDYDKEVKEARAAYPEMRKKLNLDPNTKLPGEK